MNLKCTILRVDESVNFPCYVPSTGFEIGEFLIIDTSHDYKVVPMTAATDDAVFCGISLSAAKAVTNDGDVVTIMTKGIIKVTLVSGTYHYGDGVKWASTSSLTADGGANTLGWICDYNINARTEGNVLIDIFKLAKLFAVDA